MPAVSIILPTCDRAYCLERAVRSVAMQSYENWELIIVDDGSTDATPDLCRSFANRLGSRLHYCQVHRGGVSRARNFGLERAQAPLVAFLDSDDFWHVDKLGLQLAALEKERDALFSFTGFSTFGDGGTYACECVYVPPELSGRIYPDLYRIRYNVIVTPSIVCSRELAISVGGFDEQMAMCEDIDLWGRITARTRCVAIDRPLVGVHIRPEEKYPFQQALKGRVALYRHLIARDTFLSPEFVVELFIELFITLRTVASNTGRTDVVAAAGSALKLIRNTESENFEERVAQAVALLESCLMSGPADAYS